MSLWWHMQAKILKLSQPMILLKLYVDPWWQILSKSQSSKGNFCDHHHDFGCYIQYIPRNMYSVFALLCFVVVIHWLIFPYPSGLLHWHCGNLTIAQVPAKQPWWIWINTSCEFIMNDCITTTKQSTTKPWAFFLGYAVYGRSMAMMEWKHFPSKTGQTYRVGLQYTNI